LQQSPLALLLRIVLASTNVGDWVLDPFAGTGTTGVVAEQLGRHCVLIENASRNVQMIRRRLEVQRPADSILRWRHYYRFTPNLEEIWPSDGIPVWGRETQMALFEEQNQYGSC